MCCSIFYRVNKKTVLKKVLTSVLECNRIKEKNGGYRMEEYVRKNGYVEVWIDGEFIGNYDTVEEYHREKENEDK